MRSDSKICDGALERILSRVVLCLLLCFLCIAADSGSSPTDSFLDEAFGGSTPPPSLHWMTKEDRKAATDILGHDYRHLRQRYWIEENRTAWVLDEIGKEKPITVAIVIASDGIETLQVLVYREDRGGEVQYPFFTEQFQGVSLDSDMALSRRIDGISGATMSVRALTNLSRLALYLHQRVAPKGLPS